MAQWARSITVSRAARNNLHNILSHWFIDSGVSNRDSKVISTRDSTQKSDDLSCTES